MKLTLALATAATLAAFAIPSNAATISGTCASSTLSGSTTSCDAMVPFSFESDGPGTNYGVRIKAPSSHCSKVRYSVKSGDGATEFGITRWLSAGQADKIEIGDELAAGMQVVQIVAIGKVGGCNTGVMQSWGATINAIELP